jgi:hypothetical protein
MIYPTETHKNNKRKITIDENLKLHLENDERGVYARIRCRFIIARKQRPENSISSNHMNCEKNFEDFEAFIRLLNLQNEILSKDASLNCLNFLIHPAKV